MRTNGMRVQCALHGSAATDYGSAKGQRQRSAGAAAARSRSAALIDTPDATLMPDSSDIFDTFHATVHYC